MINVLFVFFAAREEYFLAGQMISLSVVHGGPVPKFLSRDLIDHIYKPDFNVTFADIIDDQIRQILYEVGR